MTKHFLMQAVSICLFMFFVTACSSLHVDIAPSVNWAEVRVVEFQKPAESSWNLYQPIKFELQSLTFQVVDSHPEPDLLFSYFVQESPDLTVESEILVRLKSLHIQFLDPATKTRVAAADYFYPETTDPSAPETGVRDLFAALRKQILKENKSDEKKQITASGPAQVVTPELATPASPVSTPLAGQVKSVVESDQSQVEVNASNEALLSSPEDQSIKQEPKKYTTLKSARQAKEADQKTRSPWTPKFKSWGFENWGQDSVDDY